MAVAARHAHGSVAAPDRAPAARPPAPRVKSARSSRRVAARRAHLMRAFIGLVVCLTLLAVGRVALSFAVVQKTLQTDAIALEQRRVRDENQRLRSEVARLSSAMRIRHLAESDLGLVDASHLLYVKPLGNGSTTPATTAP